MEASEKHAQRWLDVKAAANHVGSTVGFIRGLIWDGSLPWMLGWFAVKREILSDRGRFRGKCAPTEKQVPHF
jgi:hypothetical protein